MSIPFVPTLLLTWLACGLLFVSGCKNEPLRVQIDYCNLQIERFDPVVDGGLVYEIYVRSFYDSDGDGIGDLRGVTEKLDHLELLGVRTVWLMPLFPSPSPAGYNPEAHDSIRAELGTEDDLKALLEAARDRGIRVLMDVPLNHTSDTHPWFEAAVADSDSKYRYYYLFSETQWDQMRWFPAPGGGYYYAFFGAEYPDLDWMNAYVPEVMVDDLLNWIDFGLSGYRLDAVIQLIEDDGDVSDTDATHCLLAWLYAELKAADPDVVVFAEAWNERVEKNQSYLGDADAPEADWVIDVPRKEAILMALMDAEPDVLAEVLIQETDAGTMNRMAPYLGSHDIDRLWERVTWEHLRRAAMALLLTLPGHPILYYGDEIDLDQINWDSAPDFPNRAPMHWDGSPNAGFTEGTPWFTLSESFEQGVNVEQELEDPTSMLRLVIALSELRNASTAVRFGAVSLLETSRDKVMAIEMRDGDQVVLVLVNTGYRSSDNTEIQMTGSLTELTNVYTLTANDAGQATVPKLRSGDVRIFATDDLAHIRIPSIVSAERALDLPTDVDRF